jgi:hypothetical protein
MQIDVREGIIIGGAAGMLLWLYDFRHVLFGGSPNTVVSDAVASIVPVDYLCRIGFEGANMSCELLAALFILTFAGVFAGMAVARLIRTVKK